MSRKVAFIVALLLSLPIIVAYRTGIPHSNTLSILPEDCRLLAGEEMLLELDGPILPNATISWSVDNGGIVPTPPGSNAIFIAPLESEVVTISVSISSSTQSSQTPFTRQCIVTSTNSVPEGFAEVHEDNELAIVPLAKALY